MKYLLIIMASALPCLAFAQLYVKGENINELDIEYITIERDVTRGAYIGLVYFDTEDDIRGRRDHITDETGETIKFRYAASIINYVSRRGWEYVDSLTNFLGNNERHLLFRRIKEVSDGQK